MLTHTHIIEYIGEATITYNTYLRAWNRLAKKKAIT